MPEEDSLDIDTNIDWIVAEAILFKKSNRNEIKDSIQYNSGLKIKDKPNSDRTMFTPSFTDEDPLKKEKRSMNIRIIPRLDIKGPNLVKGIHFEGLRVLGKPEHFARYYYENGADELIYMDAVASLYGRNSLLEIIEKTAREIFIPLTVGGGLRSIDDIRAVLRAGADKVSLNTAAIACPNLIHEASRTFGSSTIVVSIEAIRKPDGAYEAYVNYGRDRTDIDVFEWAVRAVEIGCWRVDGHFHQ